MSRPHLNFALTQTRMRWTCRGLLVAVGITLAISAGCQKVDRMRATTETRTRWGERVDLPPPVKTGRISLEEALAKRRSVREFSAKPLTEVEAGQLLWRRRA